MAYTVKCKYTFDEHGVPGQMYFGAHLVQIATVLVEIWLEDFTVTPHESYILLLFRCCFSVSILFVVYKIGVSDKNWNAQIVHCNCAEIVFYRSTSDYALTILCIVDSVQIVQ